MVTERYFVIVTLKNGRRFKAEKTIRSDGSHYAVNKIIGDIVRDEFRGYDVLTFGFNYSKES